VDVAAVLVVCGLVATAIGTWRGYVVAREALGPMVHDDGDPTRRAIDASRPLIARMRVRTFARRTAVALGWLVVATYGLALIDQGASIR
jgi:hypothetical protein